MHGKAIVPLSRWSEDRLIVAAQGGDNRAIEYLVTEYPPVRSLIRSLQRSVDPRNAATCELEAAAHLAILEALGRFDPGQGVLFTTYAYHYIRGAMLTALYARVERQRGHDGKAARVRLVPFEHVSGAEGDRGYESKLLDRDPDYGIDPGFARVEDGSRLGAVRAFVRALPDNQRTITEDVFWSERTHRDIAAERGISRPAVTRTLQRVFAHGRRELAELAPELAA